MKDVRLFIETDHVLIGCDRDLLRLTLFPSPVGLIVGGTVLHFHVSVRLPWALMPFLRLFRFGR